MSKRVLIADDLPFFRVALKDILGKGGYEVVGEATNGVEAVEKAKALLPDIVILDVVMPVKTGLDAAKEIRLLRLQTKVVMCSSLGNESIVDEALKSGACAYILKPLNEETVLSTLQGL